jgi:hypothetical protein
LKRNVGKLFGSREDYDNKLQYTADEKDKSNNIQKSQQLPVLTESNMIKSTILKSGLLSVSCLISKLFLPPISAAFRLSIYSGINRCNQGDGI